MWQTSLHNPNFAEFAQNCGATGFRVDDVAQLHDALEQALRTNAPALVEIVADPLLT